MDAAAVHRILVRAPNFIGDCVMARDFYKRVREVFPRASLVSIAPAGAAAILSRPGFSDEVWTLEDKRWRTLFAMGQKIRRGRFDLAFSLPASTSSALMLWSSGLKHTYAWAESTAAPFYRRAWRWEGRHSGKWKGDLYTSLVDIVLPDLKTSPSEGPRSQGSGAGERKPGSGLGSYVVIAPGASIDLRQWPHLPQFVRLLRQKYPSLPMKIIGAASDAQWSEKFQALGLGDRQIEDLIGKTSLSESIALCENATAVVAMDSGMAHVAATIAGAPTLVIMGPGDPIYILPKANAVVARRADLPCSPCESATCRAPYGYQACLKELTPASALESFKSLVPL